MSQLSLKIFLTDLDSVKTCQYMSDMYVQDICNDIREKFNYGAGGLDHGLLFKEQGVWLSPKKMLGVYDLKFNDTLEFRKKHRILKVKTLDDSIKSVLVDESQTVKLIVDTVCERIGITNPEEYSLMKLEPEVVDEKKKSKKDKKDKVEKGISG